MCVCIYIFNFNFLASVSAINEMNDNDRVLLKC